MEDNAQTLAEIRVIRRMIEDSGRYTGRIWTFFLIWGLVILAASVASQLLVQTGAWRWLWPLWLAASVTGTALSALAGHREARQSRRVTFLDRAVATTWTGVTITVLLLLGVSALTTAPLVMAIPFVAGTGHFAMATLLQQRLWLVGAALWWLAGVGMALRPELTFTLLGCVVSIGYVLPGLVGWWRSDRPSNAADA